MDPPTFDLVAWLLAATGFVAVGALIVSVIAIVRLDPLIARAGDPAGRPGDGARRRDGDGARPCGSRRTSRMPP
jgi:hypothetical protein